MNKNAFWMLIIIVLGGGIFFLLEKNDVYMDETATLVDTNAPVTIETNKELPKKDTYYEGIPLNEETRKLTFTNVMKELPKCEFLPVDRPRSINIDDMVTNCSTKDKTGVERIGLGGVFPSYAIYKQELVEDFYDWQRGGNDLIELAISNHPSISEGTRFVCTIVDEGGNNVGVRMTVDKLDDRTFGNKVTPNIDAIKKAMYGYTEFISMPRFPIQSVYCADNDVDCSKFIEGPWTDGTNYVVPGWKGGVFFYNINNNNYVTKGPENDDITITQNYLTAKDRISMRIPTSIQKDKIVFARLKNYNALDKNIDDGEMIDSTFTLETCDVPVQ